MIHSFIEGFTGVARDASVWQFVGRFIGFALVLSGAFGLFLIIVLLVNFLIWKGSVGRARKNG